MKNDTLEILTQSVSVEGGGRRLGTKPFLKTGFYDIFQRFLHWISTKVDRKLWDHDEWNDIDF